MKTKKHFTIEKNQKNIDWVKQNLMDSDYILLSAFIAIYYNHDFQKTDILNAIA